MRYDRKCSILLYGYLAWITQVASQDVCSGKVISLPVTDVKLDNGHTQRGVKIQVGDPPQTLAAIPALYGYVIFLKVPGHR